MNTYVKCYLQNARVINQMCGYGEGRTFEEAKQDALKIAQERYGNGYFDGRQVVFIPDSVLV